MKNEVNRAFMAKKRTYEIPSVEMTQLAMSSIICVSGGISGGKSTDELGGGAPIGD